MKKKTPYQLYFEGLPANDQALLTGYFGRIQQRLRLSKAHQGQMLSDFENALLYYAEKGLPLPQALLRLPPENLGGFYARPPSLWYPLDDAAKIYPLAMKKNQMALFRMSVYLTENIVPALLQMALNFTIKRFPSFATTVKKGFFWHYIDAAKRRFVAQAETGVPCQPINVSASGAQSFRVMYYENRISIEVFHILTDGTGGMVFLQTLLAQYLSLLGISVPTTREVMDINESPRPGETANDFPKAEPAKKASGFMGKPALQMSGRLCAVRPCQALHLCLDASLLKKAAKEKGASVTAYLLALIFIAQKYATDEAAGNIQIQVPVNMRKFYQSATIRNFSLYCSINLPITEITEVTEILPAISAQLEKKASKEAMNEMMNATVTLVRLLRYVPLFIKRPVAGLIYGFLGDKIFSNTFSNLGLITLSPEMAPHVQKFDFLLGTAVTNRASCALGTYQNTAVLSISKYTQDPSFEEKLSALLSAEGLFVKAEGSVLYGS